MRILIHVQSGCKKRLKMRKKKHLTSYNLKQELFGLEQDNFNFKMFVAVFSSEDRNILQGKEI